MAVQIQLRNDPASVWSSVNPILAKGEVGIETDTDRIKVGNGIDPWNSRPYADASVLSSLEAHVDSETPHPAYDDMPSLTLIFENGLV
jgi:hypothetical protein